MIARVALPIPEEPLDYLVPEGLSVEVGHRVQVPLGPRQVWGLVVELLPAPSQAGLKLQPVLRTAGPVASPLALELVRFVAQRSFVSVGLSAAQVVPAPSRARPQHVEWALAPEQLPEVVQKLRKRAPSQACLLQALGQGTTAAKELRKLPGASRALKALLDKGWVRTYTLPFKYHEPQRHVRLTPPQERAVEQIVQRIGEGRTCLLFGPAASGKTEVYLQAAAVALERGKAALLLEPEVSLLPQLWARARATLRFAPRAYFGEMPRGERWRTWEAARQNELRCAVGTRSAVFLPSPNLGLICLDEEGEPAYKQDEHVPYYHAREVAERRAQVQGCAVVLASAAPGVDTFFRAQQDEIALVELEERVAGWPPQARAVPRGEEVISPELREAMARHLAQGGQVLLFHNRLGFYTGATCRDCRELLRCPTCEIGLVYHRERRAYVCHACGYRVGEPRCRRCGGTRFRLFGVGTERVEHEARRLFPRAVVARLDTETARRRDAILTALAQGEIHILVGTQMVGKGLDFPRITLVGVINADQLLARPDYRASERTYQLITSAAGRAGRGPLRGEVIVQTDQADYYPIRHALTGHYRSFFEEELAYRRSLRYPPFLPLFRLIGEGSKAQQKLAQLASQLIPLGLEVLGPVPLFPLRGVTRAHMLVRGPAVDQALRQVLRQAPPWLRVDPDPMSFW